MESNGIEWNRMIHSYYVFYLFDFYENNGL
jgi:hypothetical protein